MKKAIIIGASTGIGRGMARVLTDNGYIVGITGRRIHLLEELKNENPEQYIIKAFDVKDINNNATKLSELVEELGGLDLIILNAGTGPYNYDLDFEVEKVTIETDVIGFTFIADWAFRYFKKQSYGHLVGITSIAGLRGNRVSPSYSGSKAFEIKYLEGLRQKAKKEDLHMHVTDIRPGYVDTSMTKGESGIFWLASVEKASKQIYGAIKAKKRIVYVTKRWAIIAFIIKLLPGFIYERL